MCEHNLEKPGTNIFLDDPLEFVLVRDFRAPRDLVWRVWTDPVQLARWWGPDGFSNPVCDFELRTGAPYRIVMRGPDAADYPVSGEVLEFSLNSRLVTTIDTAEHPAEFHDEVAKARGDGDRAPMVVTQIVQLSDRPEGTRLTVRQRFADQATRDASLKLRAEEGWSQSFEALDHVLSTELSFSGSENPAREIRSSRNLSQTPEAVFQAWVDPTPLAKWWGPEGFTNEFEEHDPRPGGHWRFTMVGPDGKRFSNHHIFAEVVPGRRMVMDHLSAPHFRAVVEFVPQGSGTRLDFRMVLKDAKARDAVATYAIDGNRQTLDRLERLLAEA